MRQNNYEIIGNQIKFYFKGDSTHMWNRISSPEFRSVKEIEMWCAPVDGTLQKLNCTIDGIDQNIMSYSEVGDFLYRWITAYVKKPADATNAEIMRLVKDDVFWSASKEIASDLFWQTIKAAQVVMECILYLGEWLC